MEKLSKESEETLVGAIKQAIVMVNDGSDPSDAVAKVASNMQLNQDMTARMVEAYNTSKTLGHYKHSSGEERAGEFPLADPEKVAAVMYPSEVETPAEKKADDWLAPESGLKETRVFDLTKAAGPVEREDSPDSHDGHDINMLLKRAYGLLERKERLIEDAKINLGVTKHALVASLEKAAASFKQLYGPKFQEVDGVVKGAYGDSGKQVMDILHGLVGGESHGHEKAASWDKTIAPSGEPYDLIGEIIEKSADMRTEGQALAEMQKDAEDYRVQLKQREDSLLKKALVPAAITGGLVGGAISDELKDTITKKPEPKVEVAKAMSHLEDPQLEADLRSIDAQLMLHDFLANDEVLSSHKPQDVLNAYNEVAASFPDVSRSPLMMRSLVRNLVESRGADPHLVSTIAGVESQMRRASQPQMPQIDMSGD